MPHWLDFFIGKFLAVQMSKLVWARLQTTFDYLGSFDEEAKNIFSEYVFMLQIFLIVFLKVVYIGKIYLFQTKKKWFFPNDVLFFSVFFV